MKKIKKYNVFVEKKLIYIPFGFLFMHEALVRLSRNKLVNFLTQDKKRHHFIKFYKFCK